VSVLKYNFKNDYNVLVHPQVLDAFAAVGHKQFEGYGLDEFSMRAADLVKSKIMAPSADVHFIGGGTHANLVVISSALRPRRQGIKSAR
jgi:threonine aldolase